MAAGAPPDRPGAVGRAADRRLPGQGGRVLADQLPHDHGRGSGRGLRAAGADPERVGPPGHRGPPRVDAAAGTLDRAADRAHLDREHELRGRRRGRTRMRQVQPRGRAPPVRPLVRRGDPRGGTRTRGPGAEDLPRGQLGGREPELVAGVSLGVHPATRLRSRAVPAGDDRRARGERRRVRAVSARPAADDRRAGGGQFLSPDGRSSPTPTAASSAPSAWRRRW